MVSKIMREGRVTGVRTDCATCKGRAVTCDRTKPTCRNCSRSKQKCRWSGLKLFWPRANNHRRAIVSKSPLLSLSPKISDTRFVHTSHWDIELYHSLTGSVPVRALSLLDVPELWNPSEMKALDRDLLDYFCRIVSASLAIFGHDATTLGNILVQIALEGQTASAAAVFQAIQAFASLHRYGLQPQAIELKIAALGSLAQGSGALGMGARETIQHIAAGMLFCSFEVHQSSCTSGQWTGYLAGVKTVIREASITKLLEFDPDVAVLLDWVHYHDVLAHFSLLYWKREGAPELPVTPTSLFNSHVSNVSPPILPMLNLLSQICDLVSSRAILPETGDNLDDYKSFLEIMDWRIRSLPISRSTDEHGDVSDDTTMIMQLYQLALLLYLGRISEDLINQPIKTQQNIDKAFALFPRLTSCKQQFPIFVIGCEARTDEQRAVILDVISRTEKLTSSRCFIHCKMLLQAIWAQDDLAYGNNVSYQDKLTSVISLCVIVPTFV